MHVLRQSSTRGGLVLKSRFTKNQIVVVFHEHRGPKIAELCRGYRVVENAFHRWKRQHGGLQVFMGCIESDADSADTREGSLHFPEAPPNVNS